MTLPHTVLFSFPTELSAEDASSVRDQVKSWPGTIGAFGAIRFGRDLADARTRGYQYLPYTEFNTRSCCVSTSKITRTRTPSRGSCSGHGRRLPSTTTSARTTAVWPHSPDRTDHLGGTAS